MKTIAVSCGFANIVLAIGFNLFLVFRRSLLPGIDEGMALWFRYLLFGGVVFALGLMAALLSEHPRRYQLLINASFPIGVLVFVCLVFLTTPPTRTIIERPEDSGNSQPSQPKEHAK
jgi:hypothetical protein